MVNLTKSSYVLWSIGFHLDFPLTPRPPFWNCVVSDWMMAKCLQKLVLVISSVATKEVLERWVFDIETDNKITAESEGPEKPEKEIMSEIQAGLSATPALIGRKMSTTIL